MFAKLEAVESRYAELEKQLADPDIIGRRAEFQKLSKEHSDISDLVTAYREHRRISLELEANRPLLEEKDPDLKAMAKEEQSRLTGELNALEDKLKVLLLPRDPND